jgi:hypothetical protein
MRPVLVTRPFGEDPGEGLEPSAVPGDDAPSILPTIPGLPGISEAIIQQAVSVAIHHAWPQIREQIRADIPYLIEDARPHIQNEIHRAALMLGGITLAAVAGTAAAVYFITK